MMTGDNTADIEGGFHFATVARTEPGIFGKEKATIELTEGGEVLHTIIIPVTKLPPDARTEGTSLGIVIRDGEIDDAFTVTRNPGDPLPAEQQSRVWRPSTKAATAVLASLVASGAVVGAAGVDMASSIVVWGGIAVLVAAWTVAIVVGQSDG